jgi:hypothetical protein
MMDLSKFHEDKDHPRDFEEANPLLFHKGIPPVNASVTLGPSSSGPHSNDRRPSRARENGELVESE